MERVEVHRRTLKGGGLLNLFDWSSKSRKKLLSDSNGPGMTENSSFSEISSALCKCSSLSSRVHHQVVNI